MTCTYTGIRSPAASNSATRTGVTVGDDTSLAAASPVRARGSRIVHSL
jgi:hypothetical protein